MDLESYDTLFLRMKDSLIYSTELNRKAFIASHFSSALIECDSCISKTFELATKLLEETNFQVNNLVDYIDNAITLLQMLSDFIKNVLESAALTCGNMKAFPTTTGNIILTVFLHCKDSEWIYRHHLKSVETQLKDLFRTCHELQLTYLMTLEKHFIFDLTVKQEQEILIEALNINMKIGEIVQALDIKTMAEQWKAFTVICEKYSNFLLDKHMYNRCTQIFATIITDNIKTAMESERDNKSVVRSLKVANFTIKILSRVSNVFKYAISNNYEHVVELIEYIYMHNQAYLELSAEKTQQFINLIVTNILNPTDGLCNILLQEERFLDCVYKIDVTTLETNAFLGHVILVISIIKAIVQKKEDQVLNVGKRKLIDCVYGILPLGHYWFNMGLRFQSKDGSGNEKNFSLYEHLLVHVLAMVTTFTSDEYALLEKYMFESIMSTDCYSAMFSSNLWVLLIRMSHHLASNTLSSLINIYEKLEKHRLFHNSPQEAHLSYLIGKLFEVLSNEDKMMMSKQIQPRNPLWSVLKVSNLPNPLRRNIGIETVEDLKTSFHVTFESQDVSEKEMDYLIQIMKIAGTCIFSENSDAVDQYIVRLWSKVCHKTGYIQSRDFDTIEVEWYYKYLEALVAITDCIAFKLNSASVGKILHNMSTLLYNCNTEIIILVWNLFCKLTFNRFEDENQHLIDNIFKETCKLLLKDVETWMKPNILNTLSKYNCNEQFHDMTSTCCEDESLQQELNLNCDVKTYCQSNEWKQQLLEGTHFEYVHKCRRIITDDSRKHEPVIQSTISNFDLGDFLFDEIEEPSRKKAKLDISETDSLIERLENTTSLLCQADHAALHNYKKRITNVIDKLKNIVS